MPLNPSPNYPPIGQGPYKIDRQWCMGDSLPYINENFRIFTDRTETLSATYIKTLSAGPNITITPTATGNIVAISNTVVPAVYQVKYVRNTGTAQTTDAVGNSNSRPTNATGVQILTQQITPIQIGSVIRINVLATVANTFLQGGAVVALFKDSGTQAIAATTTIGTGINNISLTYYDPVIALTPVNYYVRLYAHTAGGTVKLNRAGDLGNYSYGGALVTYLTVEEIRQ